MCKETRILYCTTGVLLDKLISSRNVPPYTHIILDEVHDRHKNMDFLLILIKKMLFTTMSWSKVKVILMSATIDAKRVSLTLMNTTLP